MNPEGEQAPGSLRLASLKGCIRNLGSPQRPAGKAGISRSIPSKERRDRQTEDGGVLHSSDEAG